MVNFCASFMLHPFQVKKFLNRMIGLSIDAQRRLFDAFAAQLEEIIWAARRDGKCRRPRNRFI